MEAPVKVSKVMKLIHDLVTAQSAIQRVREVIEQECYDDEANNPVVAVEDLLKALDGEQ